MEASVSIATIYDLYKDGKTLDHIASVTGLKRGAIAGRLFRYRKQHGIEPKPNPITLRTPYKRTPVVKIPRAMIVEVPKEAPADIKDFSQYLFTDSCRFIYGDIKEKTASFCSGDKIKHSPYCAYHHSQCYRRGNQ